MSKQRQAEVRSRHVVEEKDSYEDDYEDDFDDDDAPKQVEQKKPSAFAKPMGMQRKKKKKRYT